MALHNLATMYFYILSWVRTPHDHEFVETTLGFGHGHTWLHNTLEDPRPHNMMLEVSWDGLWTLLLGSQQFHGHGSWLECEVALNNNMKLDQAVAYVRLWILPGSSRFYGYWIIVCLGSSKSVLSNLVEISKVYHVGWLVGIYWGFIRIMIGENRQLVISEPVEFEK